MKDKATIINELTEAARNLKTVNAAVQKESRTRIAEGNEPRGPTGSIEPSPSIVGAQGNRNNPA